MSFLINSRLSNPAQSSAPQGNVPAPCDEAEFLRAGVPSRSDFQDFSLAPTRAAAPTTQRAALTRPTQARLKPARSVTALDTKHAALGSLASATRSDATLVDQEGANTKEVSPVVATKASLAQRVQVLASGVGAVVGGVLLLAGGATLVADRASIAEAQAAIHKYGPDACNDLGVPYAEIMRLAQSGLPNDTNALIAGGALLGASLLLGAVTAAQILRKRARASAAQPNAGV